MNKQNTFKRTIGNKKGISAILVLSLLLLATCTFAVKEVSATASTYSLGAAASFSVLAGSAVTNTGPSVITGDVGVSPGTSITGFLPGIVNAPGAIHKTDTLAANAQTDATTAYNYAVAQPTTMDLTGKDLGGLILTPGVYSYSSSAGLTGTLTLNAQGDPNAFFFFKIGSSLTTASSSMVLYTNGAQPCNVVWAVKSSATLGTGSTFVGTILAQASITATTGDTVYGRLLAKSAVTLDTDTINNQTGQTLNVLPEYTLGALAALGASFAALLVYKRKSLPSLHLNTHI
jgi:hypothetical protein